MVTGRETTVEEATYKIVRAYIVGFSTMTFFIGLAIGLVLG